MKYVHYEAVVHLRHELDEWRKTDEYVNWYAEQIRKQNNICYYCTSELINRKVNVEHAMPLGRGGDNTVGNLVLACWNCNKLKGNDIYEHWRDKDRVVFSGGYLSLELNQTEGSNSGYITIFYDSSSQHQKFFLSLGDNPHETIAEVKSMFDKIEKKLATGV